MRTRIGGKGYTQKKAKELHERLEQAHTLVSAAESIAIEPVIRAKLSTAKDALHKVNGPIGKYLNVRDKIRNVIEVINAIDDFGATDASKDARKFARAAGSMFKAVGKLGEGLPFAGPYFTILSNMGNFFTNMQNKLDPGLRWHHKPEAKYLP